MILKELDIINFKNIASSKLTFSPSFNCFVGKNGSGKTNVLDAIYHLGLCKSYFSLTDAQVIKHGEPFYMLQASYEGQDDHLNIYCAYKRGEKKIFKKNNKAYTRLSEHIGLLPLVMISPNDFILVDGPSEERRKFLDSIVSQFDSTYLYHLISYNKILTQRNVLLKQMLNSPDSYMLEVLNEQLARAGNYIKTEREKFLTEFVVLFQNYYTKLSLDREIVSLEYVPSVKSGDMLVELNRVLSRDKILTYTSVGVHRDELSLKLDGHLIKKIGSQGQKKTFLVALKLAQYEVLSRRSVNKPALLLDDVFDKLDADRVAQIMSLVRGDDFGQVFITDTNRHNIVELLQNIIDDFALFIVDNGEVVKQE